MTTARETDSQPELPESPGILTNGAPAKPPIRAVGIITKRFNEEAQNASRELAEWLHNRGIQVTVTPDTARRARIPKGVARRAKQKNLPEGQDLTVVIGGDGTFIAAAGAIGLRDVPLLGINMGRLGFLTEIAVETMFNAMEEVLDGHYEVEERTMLATSILREGREMVCQTALNDAVIHKGDRGRMIEFEVAIDARFLFSNRADGLIVATPTGSTAYTLSSGGPIIHPALGAFVLTLVSPHTLTQRPIAVPDCGDITITMIEEGPSPRLTMDGHESILLTAGDQIRIRRAERKLRIVHTPAHNYYGVLRAKLHWGEKVGV
ncbi:MAG: NAD(+)/NADH kinase [Magnetococcales bacterium]|nr:NAD(+)/NADH kinase [Magnetococcales bacterium]